MRLTLTLALACSSFAAGLAFSTQALAEGVRRASLLIVEISGDGAPELRKQLQARIVAGLSKRGAKVTDNDQTLEALKDSPDLIGCSSSACLEQVADLTNTDHFVRATITASGANYEFTLSLLQASGSEPVLNTVSNSCAVCTIAELGDQLEQSAERLLDPDARQLVAVRIASNPSGAEIKVDGLDAGNAPLDYKLSPGMHTLEARLPGRNPSSKEVDVQATQDDEQRFELVLPPELKANSETSPYYKWGVAAGSVSLLALGTVLVAINGDPSCDSSAQTCAQLNDTILGGALSLSAGVLLGGVAGYLFWKDMEGPPEEGLSLSVGSDGVRTSYRVSF